MRLNNLFQYNQIALNLTVSKIKSFDSKKEILTNQKLDVNVPDLKAL